MQGIKKSIFVVLAIMSSIVTAATFTQYARSASSWGLPFWAWGAIGLAVLFISLGIIVYGYWKRAKSFESQLQEVTKDSESIPVLFVEIQHYDFGTFGPARIGCPLGKENSLWICLRYTALKRILVESMELKVVGRCIPCPSWKSQVVIGSDTLYVRFEIPDWVSAGRHEAQLIVFAEEHKIESVKRFIDFPNLVSKGD